MYLVPPPTHTMFYQLSPHEKALQKNAILYFKNPFFYQNMCHWVVQLNKILSRYISLHKALFSLVLSFLSYSPMRITESCVLSRCVNNWPRWSETYPNIQTHVFFPAQDISSDKYYGKVAVSKTLFTLALPKVNGFF